MIDLRPSLLQFRQAPGETWLLYFQLLDSVTKLPISLLGYNIVAEIYENGGLMDTLSIDNGIAVASDKLAFTVQKNWISIENGVLDHPVEEIAIGTYDMKIWLESANSIIRSLIYVQFDISDLSTDANRVDPSTLVNQVLMNNSFVVGIQTLNILSLVDSLSTQKDFLKPYSGTYTDLEKKIIAAIRVLDITVPASEKTDDWRITFVTTVPSTAGLLENFKYRVQIRNITKGKDYALVNENLTFDATALNGFKSYSGTVSNAGTSVDFNIQIDWTYLLSLGATFEYNFTLPSNLKLKTGIFSQKADIIKLIEAGDANLKNIIDNGRYDFLLDKTKSLSINENHILRAIKLLDITVPSNEKTDDWRITFVSTMPVTMGLVANFKYRFQIRNLTKGKDYALINQNSTFDASSINGYKSYSGTVVTTGTTIEYNIQFDWAYMLSIGEMFEFNNYGSNLSLKTGVFSQSTDIKKRLDILEALALGGSSTISDAINAAVNAALASSSIITTIQAKLDMIAGFRYEVSATYDAISTNTFVRLVFVQADSNNANKPGLYFHDGTALNLLLLL